MTSQEFVIWLKGFTEGVHEFNVSPKQWDLLKERLAEVNDNTSKTVSGTSTTRISPIMPLPYYPDPTTNPFKVTCDGTVATSYPADATLTFTTGSMMTYTTGKTLLKDSHIYTYKKKNGKS